MRKKEAVCTSARTEWSVFRVRWCAGGDLLSPSYEPNLTSDWLAESTALRLRL